MIYLDTSVLLSAYLDEAASERVLDWLAEQSDQLCISGWLHLEFVSAIEAKARGQVIEGKRRDAVLMNFADQWLRRMPALPIKPGDFARAAAMISQAPGLRGGDALHLAIAEAHGAALATLDRQQAQLGANLGVRTMLL